MANNAGRKQSISKLTGTGASPRKNLKMSSGWKQLNVKATHSKNRGRNTRRG
jgi:hypothetical protein